MGLFKPLTAKHDRRSTTFKAVRGLIASTVRVATKASRAWASGQEGYGRVECTRHESLTSFDTIHNFAPTSPRRVHVAPIVELGVNIFDFTMQPLQRFNAADVLSRRAILMSDGSVLCLLYPLPEERSAKWEAKLLGPERTVPGRRQGRNRRCSECGDRRWELGLTQHWDNRRMRSGTRWAAVAP